MTRTRARIPLLLVAIALLAVAVMVVPHIGTIPLTGHAKTAHQSQVWNATTVQAHMVSCSPKLVFLCPSREEILVLCPTHPGSTIWTGLVIGIGGTEPVIVTGYAARKSFWMKAVKDDGCIPTVMP